MLAHESAIDAAWDRELRPLLLQRFPRSTPDELERARSFAYGGSVIQDLGYYPFGNKFFSNLLHYARTGDFVESLMRNAQTVDELAFALGALAHYANDIAGHPLAVNRRCRWRFPSCARSSATTSPTCRRPSSTSSSSSRSTWRRPRAGATRSRSTASLLDFQVATALLDRAFRDTYGLEMSDLFADEERAISTYRYSRSAS